MTRRRRGRPPQAAPERYVGPPTVVSVSWDHGYESVLENRSPGIAGVCLLQPAELGLSAELTRRLAAWLERQEVLAGGWVRGDPGTHESRRADRQSSRDLLTLAHEVQHELGPDVEVLLHGRPLAEHRRR